MIASAALGQVVLRGSGDVQRAEVMDVSLEGVRVGGDEGRVIGLDGIKVVVGVHAEEWALVRKTAEKAWRARVRLARGDIALAAPLFEELYGVYRGMEGPTALLVHEGAVRCRLAVGDRDGAVEAWLGALSLRRRGHKIAGDPPLDPVIDEATGLVPELAPIWGRGEATGGVGAVWLPEYADGFVRVLGEMYAQSAQGESTSDVDVSVVTEGRARDTAVFVGVVIDAVCADAKKRAAARGRLGSGLEKQVGTWREAWIRAALGRSYLMEPGESAQTNGVLHLLHVPARFGEAQRYLAGVAVSEVGIAFAAWGDTAVAEILLGEMRAAHPGHASVRAIEEAVLEMGGVDMETRTNKSGAG